MARSGSEEQTSVSDPSVAPEADNCNTMVVALDSFEIGERAPLPAEEAFRVAYRRLRAAASSSDHAVVAAAVDPRGRVVAEGGLEDGRALTIGRHSQCLFRLAAGDISLRQMTLHVRVEGGVPVIRLWDLRSGQPFATEDGRPSSAVVAEGPLFVTVSEYSMVILPARDYAPWPEDPAEAWRSLPEREFIERRGVTGKRRAPQLVGDRLARGVSCITRLEAPSLLGVDPDAGPPWAEMTVADRQEGARFKLSAEQMNRGVLLGRSSRCLIGWGSSGALSRVHLLVVRIGPDVWAIDTASTNGTRRSGCNIEAVVLRDDDRLELPGHIGVHFRRLARAGA